MSDNTALILHQVQRISKNNTRIELVGVFSDFESLHAEMKRQRKDNASRGYAESDYQSTFPTEWHGISPFMWSSVPGDELLRKPKQVHLVIVKMKLNQFMGFAE